MTRPDQPISARPGGGSASFARGAALVPVLLLILLYVLLPASPLQAQQKSYELLPAPDLWYNDVDGIRVGLRLRGQVPGTFQDGPHRLDLGAWVSTWWPDHPFSYYLSFTEPISSLSEFGSEANLRLVSSIRTGLHRHGLSFNKRWQPGFDETTYRELSLFLRAEQRYETEYTPWPRFWREGWLWLAGTSLEARGSHGGGPWLARLEAAVNVAGDLDSFSRFTLELQQRLALGDSFALHGRFFGGASGGMLPSQYAFSRSMSSPAEWVESGLTRAKGTIPQPWLTGGFIHVGGGPNLRGYTWQDVQGFNESHTSFMPPPPLFRSVAALNLELRYPNPADRLIQEIPVIGGVLELRSYLFFDAGTSLEGNIDLHRDGNMLADAGPGFMLALNIPDYLGKPRGIMLRYDLPLWLSHPGEENSFKFRNIIGLGAVISL